MNETFNEVADQKQSGKLLYRKLDFPNVTKTNKEYLNNYFYGVFTLVDSLILSFEKYIYKEGKVEGFNLKIITNNTWEGFFPKDREDVKQAMLKIKQPDKANERAFLKALGFVEDIAKGTFFFFFFFFFFNYKILDKFSSHPVSVGFLSLYYLNSLNSLAHQEISLDNALQGVQYLSSSTALITVYKYQFHTKIAKNLAKEFAKESEKELIMEFGKELGKELGKNFEKNLGKDMLKIKASGYAKVTMGLVVVGAVIDTIQSLQKTYIIVSVHEVMNVLHSVISDMET
jgi:hypothetical protein